MRKIIRRSAEMKSSQFFISMKKLKLYFILSFLLLIIAGCSSSIPLFEYPPDWIEKTERDNTVKNYSNYLAGKIIYLDPGHGGEDRRNTNPDGDVVEADVNLRVCLALKEYLEQAGAKVLMTRDKDATVALGKRSELANDSPAELFISVHHNAPGKAEDVSTNYTSVYYHAKETDFEHEPSNRDLARYIARDLSYVMRNSTGLGSFDGSYSDYNIYPGEGFSVLRRTKIPAVLIEGAFHTSRWEELRLNNEDFNRIQAWGIFRGIAKYYRAGIPQIELIADSAGYAKGELKMQFALKDTSGIDHRSIKVYLGKEEKEFKFDKQASILSLMVGDLKEGKNSIRILCANKNGNHSRPYFKNFKITDGKLEIQ